MENKEPTLTVGSHTGHANDTDNDCHFSKDADSSESSRFTLPKQIENINNATKLAITKELNELFPTTDLSQITNVDYSNATTLTE
jgi:hypothetical protein